MPISVQWKAVASIGRPITSLEEVGTVAFTARPSPRVYLQLGVPLDYAYVPIGLTPTATFHQVLRNELQKNGHPQDSKTPPFQISVPGLGICPFRIRARIYTPNIAAVTFQVNVDSEMDVDADFARLASWRSLDALESIKKVCQLTLGIIDSGSHKDPTRSVRFKTLPALHLTVPADSETMPQFLRYRKRQIAALLLGIKKVQGIDPSLVDAPLQTNKELNKKASDEQLLLNKQGSLYLTANDSPHQTYTDRFMRMTNLVELGYVFQVFLGEYRRIRLTTEDFGDYILTRIREWLDHPAAVLATSYSNRLAWDVIAGEFQLHDKMALIAGNRAIVNAVSAKQPALESVADHWWEKREFARVFDNAITNSQQVLGRIRDPLLRESILLDMREAQRAYESKSFKSAVVMSGSAVEAMSLALLQQETAETGLNNKALHDYLDLVSTYNLIPDAALIKMLDNSLREWRNLIHPGRVQRTGVSITSGHAEIAIAAMNAFASSLK